jgi:dipeptidyl aminopeptidase/acylaminoacyl peptidase
MTRISRRRRRPFEAKHASASNGARMRFALPSSTRRLSTRRALVVALATVGCALPAGAASPTFALDAVLAAPFVDELTASPDRRALVWTIHERGARNVAIWKDGTARELTHASADDGEELDGVQFVPGNDAVVYARGGAGQDGGGENPNPTAPATRVARKIVLTSVASGATIELGEGREPAVSPKGDRVAWIGADSQVAIATIASNDGGATWTAGKVERPFTLRGRASGPLRWSPDGSKVAVANRRGDHAYIAIYTLGAATVTFAAPSFFNDGNPVWSPDGSRIAFVREPGSADDVTFYDPPERSAPWQIVVADATTGRATMTWRAPRGRGAEFSVADGVQPLWWLRGDDLVFVWERDGWRHLYSMPASGGPPNVLTAGPFEVEQVSLAADERGIVYTSNQGDLDARHVWRVVPGSAPQRATSGPNNQWSPAALSDGRIAYVDASATKPGTVTLADSSGTHALSSAPPPEFPAASLVQPTLLTFKAADGLTIHGQLFRSRDGASAHPGLIFVHGGPERQILASFHYFEAYTNLYELNQYLVSRGFDVLSINYRSGIMYGRDFREAPRRGPFGASEYQDVLAGAKFLAAQRGVDGSRLGIYGLSYGGYLTALALARNSDIFKAGADQSGVHDWSAIVDDFSGRRVGTPAQRALAFASSPLASVDRWRSPVYLDHGDDDRNVPFSQTVTLANALLARGVDVTLESVPDELHEFTVYAHEVRRFQNTANFLSERLHVRAPER